MTDTPESSLPKALRAPSLPFAAAVRFPIILLLALILFGSFISWFAGAFSDQGYAPTQPIAYSHKLHAGDMHIPCLFCHFNAERGEHAGIPPMSVCLGCHGRGLGAVAANHPEIQKLQAIVDSGSYTDADGIIHDGGVVHWRRVHKLPDFVYFTHQFHLAAGIACQTCHGPVETMTVVRQYASLSMGWCLDCHLRTNYVGGPAYRPDAPSTFSVGSANYDVMRAQDAADPPILFAPRKLNGNASSEQDYRTAGALPANDGRIPAPGWETDAARLRASLARLLAAHPDLADRPRWRLVDLPETHRDAYRQLFLLDHDGLPIPDLTRTFMNAPTQCSTCHQ
jgi:hypothetical protein